MQRTSMMTSPRSTSSVTGLPTVSNAAHRLVVEAELAQAHALGVGVHAHAVQRRHGVGRGVLARRGASSTITPSPTRGDSLESESSALERELPSAIMRAKRLKMST
jgi:hypothetical protein